MERKKRRKPKSQRREGVVRFRVTNAEWKTLQSAADRERLDLSAWLRWVALKAADSSPQGR